MDNEAKELFEIFLYADGFVKDWKNLTSEEIKEIAEARLAIREDIKKRGKRSMRKTASPLRRQEEKPTASSAPHHGRKE